MKTLLLYFSILISITQTQAQVVFNRSFHHISDAPNPTLVNIGSDLYFTAQDRIPFYNDSCYLFKYDNVGNLKFRSSVLGAYKADKAFVSNDNCLIVVGHNTLCDYDVPSNNFIGKIDSNGILVFKSVYSSASQGFSFNDIPKAALQYSDSSYFTFTDSLLLKHSKSGQFISKTNLGIHEISSALLLPNNSILISAKQNSVNALVIIAPSGVISNTVTFPVLLNKMLFYGSSQKIMGLGTNGNLYKISLSFGLIGSSSFQNNAIVNDFVCSDDTIYSIHSNLTNLSNYRICDTSFTDIFISSTSTHSFTQNAICVSNKQVNILATGIASRNSFNNGSHTFTSLSQLNKFASNNFQNDLKVLSVNADSSYTYCYPNPFQPGTNICTPYLRANVLIKNVGSTTINHFKLNCFEVPSVACGIHYYQESISNLNLLPGNSITVTTSGFANRFNGAYTTPGFSAEFCFYISLPNGETDKTYEDNEACKSFTFLVTGLKENAANKQFIRVSPNPFKSELNLETDADMKGIKVFNTLGQVILTQETSGKSQLMSTADFQTGIYFLHIETEKGTVIKKVLKN